MAERDAEPARRDGSPGRVRARGLLPLLRSRQAGRSVPLQIQADGILLNCGGRVGYAAEILRQGLILAKGAGFDHFLAVCDKDNLASEKVILKNGGIREDKRCDKEEQVFVKRFWIDL